MKISEQGQITIPPVLREKYGYLPQAEIDFEEKDGALLLLVRNPKLQQSVLNQSKHGNYQFKAQKLQHINLYCDESRHTSDPNDIYMVIGGISCPRNRKYDLVHQIHKYQQKFNTQGQFGWRRLSPNRKEFYNSLIRLFSHEPDLTFRCLVISRDNQSDNELGFYQFYYQLLIDWLAPKWAYHIYLDWQQNSEQQHFIDYRDILVKKLSGWAKIACLELNTAHNLPLMELTDLFVGAVGYAWNARQGSPTKMAFCQNLAKATNLTALNSSTLPMHKFTIVHI